MKLLPRNLSAPKSDDMLGRGIDVALTVALLFGIGFALDRWLGTTPIFMIALSLLGAIGFFAKFKYQYDAAMDEHEAARLEQVNAGRTEDRHE
jgi:F0F1-type ATP synthase assembly protein I